MRGFAVPQRPRREHDVPEPRGVPMSPSRTGERPAGGRDRGPAERRHRGRGAPGRPGPAGGRSPRAR
jgi:hypothetical protein